ncbi:hypothetical protein SK128_007638, partial [Halocaridina rubra]
NSRNCYLETLLLKDSPNAFQRSIEKAFAIGKCKTSGRLIQVEPSKKDKHLKS